jgi:hypothetical protein
MVGAVVNDGAIGGVFVSELQAGEAVRALHFWNRAQAPRPLGHMCVVARRGTEGTRYLPHKVPTAAGGAWRGLLVGLVAAGMFGAGAGTTLGVLLSDALTAAQSAADTAISMIGRSPGFDVHQAISQARTSSLAGAVALGVGSALAGALVGGVLGAILGALAHGVRGFRRSVRRGVADLLRPGGAAVVAWTRDGHAAALAELRRLGGDPWPDLLPPQRSVPVTATPEAEGGQRSA